MHSPIRTCIRRRSISNACTTLQNAGTDVAKCQLLIHPNIFVLGLSQTRFGIGPLIYPGSLFIVRMLWVQTFFITPIGVLLKNDVSDVHEIKLQGVFDHCVIIFSILVVVLTKLKHIYFCIMMIEYLISFNFCCYVDV